jgi:hypothetical protein
MRRIVNERTARSLLGVIIECLTADSVPTARGGLVCSTSSVQPVLVGHDAT